MSYLLSLPKGTELQKRQRGLALSMSLFEWALPETGPGCLSALSALIDGATRDELISIVREKDGYMGLPHLFYILNQLDDAGIINRTVREGENWLATLVPTSRYFRFSPEPVPRDRILRLSRFTCCRIKDGVWIAESPLAHALMEIRHEKAHLLLFTFSQGVSLQDLTGRSDLPRPVLMEMIGLMRLASLLVPVNTDDVTSEQEDPDSRQWAFHDLFMHVHSRKGRRRKPFGATFRFRGELEPPPVLKPEAEAEGIPLSKPDQGAEMTLSQAMETRKSTRTFGAKPIGCERLGHFLYRTARIKKIITHPEMELSLRPYPGGGACYEIELYLAVNACTGLAAGLYRYRPDHHDLVIVAPSSSETERLVQIAADSAKAENVQVVFILAARFQRVFWKYESMAYALILKNVGVLFQNMYLTATAMGLGACALGGGDAEQFARASGCDYLVEGSVGEFLLGSMPEKT